LPRHIGERQEHERVAYEARVGAGGAHHRHSAAAWADFEEAQNSERHGNCEERAEGENSHIGQVEHVTCIACCDSQKEQSWQRQIKHEAAKEAHVRGLEQAKAHAEIAEAYNCKNRKDDAENGQH